MLHEQEIKGKKILVVDDQEVNVRVLHKLLTQDGYSRVETLTDSRQVVPAVAASGTDLIILDIQMPHLNGIQVLEQLQPYISGVFLPVLVLTADVNHDTRIKALDRGAKDFLLKPIDATEARLRIRNLLLTRTLYQQVVTQNQYLEDRVAERTERLEVAQREILDRLARASEYRDDNTGEHARRVGRLAYWLGLTAQMSEQEARMLLKAAPLHDVGKIGVPDGVLSKEGSLSDEERMVIQRHPEIGAEILNPGDFDLMHAAHDIALCHHERWDGTGYPRGLAGEAIPLNARIVAIADAFDALTHDRPYREAQSVHAAVAELQRCSGTQFDPELVGKFMETLKANGIL